MKVRSRLVKALMVFMCVSSSELWSQEVVLLDEIVVKVNQEIITLSDLQVAVGALRNEVQQTVQDPEAFHVEFEKQRRALLKGIIEKKLMVQKADELGLAGGMDLDVAAALEANRNNPVSPVWKSWINIFVSRAHPWTNIEKT